MTPPPPPTTEEIEAVRSAYYSHDNFHDACAAAGIAAERVPQFERIFGQLAAAAAKSRPGKMKRAFKPKRWGRR